MCTQSHDALKIDVALWNRLPLVGVQHAPADDWGPEERLELRNCACGSTLAVSIDAARHVALVVAALLWVGRLLICDRVQA